MLNPFGGSDDASFGDYGEFDPEHLPEPGPALEGHDVLHGREHAAVHRLARELFEERGVYDATFGYNLARLNLDRRHSEAGFRYARDAADPDVLWAEFTPTTEFCPQVDALTKGAYRAWNGLNGRHEFEEVRVRVRPDHHEADAVNSTLRTMEREGVDPDEPTDDADGSTDGTDTTDEAATGDATSAPF